MKILLLGASSYIGSRIYYDLHGKYDIVGTYNTTQLSNDFIQIDITDHEAVKKLVAELNPDIIIHLANFSSPRFTINNEENFTKLNLESTRTISQLAHNSNIKLIFFSSMAATTLQNLYSELKAQSEQLVGASGDYFIIRPSAVIGMSPNQKGNNFSNKVLSVINRSGEQFDSSWVLQPTYIGHISQVIGQVISKNIWNKTINLFTNHPVTQFQIASDILALFNIVPESMDKHLSIPLAESNIKDLEPFSISPSSYEEIISTIVQEIKDKDKFTL